MQAKKALKNDLWLPWIYDLAKTQIKRRKFRSKQRIQGSALKFFHQPHPHQPPTQLSTTPIRPLSKSHFRPISHIGYLSSLISPSIINQIKLRLDFWKLQNILELETNSATRRPGRPFRDFRYSKSHTVRFLAEYPAVVTTSWINHYWRQFGPFLHPNA